MKKFKQIIVLVLVALIAITSAPLKINAAETISSVNFTYTMYSDEFPFISAKSDLKSDMFSSAGEGLITCVGGEFKYAYVEGKWYEDLDKSGSFDFGAEEIPDVPSDWDDCDFLYYALDITLRSEYEASSTCKATIEGKAITTTVSEATDILASTESAVGFYLPPTHDHLGLVVLVTPAELKEAAAAARAKTDAADAELKSVETADYNNINYLVVLMMAGFILSGCFAYNYKKQR